jgi:hypothetical protein
MGRISGEFLAPVVVAAFVVLICFVGWELLSRLQQ